MKSHVSLHYVILAPAVVTCHSASEVVHTFIFCYNNFFLGLLLLEFTVSNVWGIISFGLTGDADASLIY